LLAVLAAIPWFNAFKQLGFQIFPVPSNEVITALNSGMVESFYSSPLGAAGFQWFAKAPYLLDLRVCPFVGVMVVNSRTWARVPVKYREVLIRRTEELIKELDGEIDNLERQAIEVMKQNGLTVVHATAEEEALWREDMLNSSKKTIGTVFPLEMYQRILQALGRAE
jgi:TRAP-type transport system periplasmic protein